MGQERRQAESPSEDGGGEVRRKESGVQKGGQGRAERKQRRFG